MNERRAGGAHADTTVGKPPSRREEIVRTATKLFSERGYEGASMEMLAQAVGLRKASLFHHFPSKDALYEEVLGGLLSDVGMLIATTSSTEGPYLERLSAFADALIDVWGGRPHAARLLFREAMDRGLVMQKWLGAAIQSVLNASLGIAEEGKRLGHFAGMEPKNVVMSLVGVFLVPFVIDNVTTTFFGDSLDTPSALAIRKVAVRAQVVALAGARVP